ncbi:glycoside hydrolase family 9 protein [Saccharicrinis fermentans]|uniref:glycoside hydrolase family 9 protein n=1 Tax=Saccharicrinis fermentans TaxID=982 RepID=UPI0004B27073
MSQNDCGKDNYPSQFPARAYLDKECSYSTNEIAINWNAPFCYLVWGLNKELNR